MNENETALHSYFNGDELAANVWLSKYAQEGEITPLDMHRRMSKEFARIEKGYIKSDKSIKGEDLSEYGKKREDLTEDKIFNFFKDFKYIVPQGSVMSQLGSNSIGSLSNCFVVGQPDDSYGGIFQKDEEMAQLFKRRGGVGIDISTLRPDGTPTSNAAKSSTGAISFMHRFSNTTREVAMNGRRAALMVSIDINHPDVLEFIKIKRDLTQVTGANISVKLNDEFMKAVENDEDYYLRFPCDNTDLFNIELPYNENFTSSESGLIIRKIRAKEYWDEIIKSAHNVAEPGLMFWDSMVDLSPDGVYPQYKQVTTNPCCFSESCKVDVITKDGVKDIRNVTSSDSVWLDNECKFVETKGYTNYGESDVYKVVFSNGDELVVTDNHKFAKVIRDENKQVKIDFALVQLKHLGISDEIRVHNPLSLSSGDNGVNYTKIKSIEYVGKDQVGCIEVPDYHYFTANSIISGNSEIAMQPYDACRLIAVNLFNFVDNPFTDNATFNFDKFYNINYEAMRLSDDLIELELEYIERILEKISSDPESIEVKKRELDLWNKVKLTAESSRRTGLGFTALGDTVAALGLKYDSDESLEMIKKISKIKMESEFDCTIDLAILRGAFKGWDSNLEYPSEDIGGNDFYTSLIGEFPEQYKRMQKYGRRNVSFSTVAPTGTVSLMTQTTSGVEPLFQPFYTRRKKVNSTAEGVKVDFVDQNGDRWEEFSVLHPKFKDWLLQSWDEGNVENMNNNELDTYFKLSPWYGSTANDINWVKRVEIQSIIQKYITHSISSTINLPEDVSEQEVAEIYMQSWKMGLKGITVYRDGSRSGVLISNDKAKKESDFEYKDAPKRPKSLPIEVHSTVSQGVKWNVFVGLLNGNPYEVFATPYFTNETGLELLKVKKGKYNLVKDGEIYSENVMAEMGDNQETLTRLISTSLRHGADIKFIVEQLNKTSGDITSFSKAISRSLKKYIPDGSKSGVKCSSCGSENVIFEEGCHRCLDCGSSACG